MLKRQIQSAGCIPLWNMKKRNQGIGTKAIQLFTEEAKKNGIEEIKVEMDENDKNIAVFIKQGFMKVSSTVFAKNCN